MEDIMQRVYLGTTQSGKCGYFTDGFLALSIPDRAFKTWTTEQHTEYCKRFNFKYVTRDYTSWIQSYDY